MKNKNDKKTCRVAGLFLSTFPFYQDCISVLRVPSLKIICNSGLRIKLPAVEARNDMLF